MSTRLILTIDPEEGGGFVAGLGHSTDEDPSIIAGIYGDTQAEAAMTAISWALGVKNEDDLSGWRHVG